MNKYYVATKLDSNQYELNEFDNLTQAFKFYLADAGKRMILREVNPYVAEK